MTSSAASPFRGTGCFIERDAGGRELLAFAPVKLSTDARGQHVEAHVLSGTNRHVPSGTGRTCYQEPERPNSSSATNGFRLA